MPVIDAMIDTMIDMVEMIVTRTSGNNTVTSMRRSKISTIKRSPTDGVNFTELID